jgi:hypothetical protein
VPDRNGKIFYTSITSLSHISKARRLPPEDVPLHNLQSHHRDDLSFL